MSRPCSWKKPSQLPCLSTALRTVGARLLMFQHSSFIAGGSGTPPGLAW